MTIRVKSPNAQPTAAGAEAPAIISKTYDSFVIPFYEDSTRVIRRRNKLQHAREYAKEVATRLNRDGARAEFLTERDRRIYTWPKPPQNRSDLKWTRSVAVTPICSDA